MTLTQFVALLAEPKKTTAGFDARCPAHEDARASLSVAAGDRGIVLTCHAGCSVAAVVGALNLRMADLFADTATPRREAPARSAAPAAAREKSKIVAEYTYLDSDGACAYQVVRFAPKDFRQRRRPREGEPSKGGWVWSVKGVPLLLYRLPDVLAAAEAGETVYVVEGEKDADALAGLGVTATSATGGAAAKWLPSYTEALRGAGEVIVIPDRDAAGEQHADKILAALNVAGILARKLVLPGDGKDSADWVAAGGDAVILAVLTAAPQRPALRPAVPGDPPGPAPLRDLGRNLESACRIIRDDTARELALWPGALGYNLMSGRVECGGRAVEDHHVTHLREQIARQYQLPGGGTPLRLTGEQVREAVELVGQERAHHPVEVWLRALPSAGAGHIDRIARQGLGITDDREAGLIRKWFIAAAARALRPGCQVDTALVLAGEQGVLKTSFFRTLAGPWYGSGPVRPDDKDTLARLHRSWIYEWAELASMNRRSMEELRDFMTTNVDFWRPPYGRTLVERPRRTVFAGSTNVLDFLTDTTGNRRFWPLRILGTIDVAVAAELRAPAFAEARDALAAGEPWWLATADEAAQTEATAAFESVDPWQQTVEEWLSQQWALGRNCFTTLEIVRFAIHTDVSDVGHGEGHRIATVMRKIPGWTTSRERLPDRPRARYWRPAESDAPLAGLPVGYRGEGK